MMTMLVANVVAVVAVGIVALLRGRDRRVDGLGYARAFMTVGLIILGLQAAFLGLFGFGEVASGDLSGAGHLLPFAGAVLLGFLAWKRPIEGSVALIAVGVATASQFPEPIVRLIMAGPQLVSGALFLVGGAAGWSASLPKEP